MDEHEVMEFEWYPTHFYFEVHGSSKKVLEVWREYGSDQIWATIHADGEPTQYLDDFESVCANWSDPVAVVAAVRQIATTYGLFPEAGAAAKEPVLVDQQPAQNNSCFYY